MHMKKKIKGCVVKLETYIYTAVFPQPVSYSM